MLRSVVVAALLSAATAAWADSVEDKASVCSACHGEKGLPDGARDPDHLGAKRRLSLSAAPRLPEGRAQGRSHDADRSEPDQGGRVGARRVFRRQAVAKDKGAGRFQGGRGGRDDGDQVGGVLGAAIWRNFRAIPSVPRLAGQQHDYLAKTMTTSARALAPTTLACRMLMNTVTPEQVTAIAAYLAGL